MPSPRVRCWSRIGRHSSKQLPRATSSRCMRSTRHQRMLDTAPSTYSAAVSWIHVTGPDALRLYRNGNAADFRPDAECLRPGGSLLGGSDVIAAEMKQAVDLIVG